ADMTHDATQDTDSEDDNADEIFSQKFFSALDTVEQEPARTSTLHFPELPVSISVSPALAPITSFSGHNINVIDEHGFLDLPPHRSPAHSVSRLESVALQEGYHTPHAHSVRDEDDLGRDLTHDRLVTGNIIMSSATDL